MSMKTLKGRETLIGPTFEVELPIELDPREYPGAIVYTNDSIHFFSDGTQWVSFNDLVSEIRRPVILNPEDEGTTKDVTPEIVATPRSSLFGKNELLWRQFQVKLASDFNWNSPIINEELQQDNYQIKSNLDFLTDYQVRVRDRDDLGSVSSWSVVITFSTPDNVVTPTNLSPQNEQIDVQQQPFLVATEFETSTFSEEHVDSEFYVENMDTGKEYNSGGIGPERSFEMPAGFIGQEGNQYRWQCRYKGDTTGWSQWSSFTTFISQNPRVIQPENVLPNDGADNLAVDNVRLQSTTFQWSVTADTHIASEWEIYFAFSEDLAHTSEETSDDLERYQVPPDALEGNTEYFWRVRHKGQILGWSKWSEPTNMTPFEAFIVTPRGISPASNELVGQKDQLLESGPFEVQYADDTHVASEWRVIDALTQLVIYGPVKTTTLLTQHTVPGSNFEPDTFYEWQVRYKGDQFGWSDWSSPKSFQVASRFITRPTNVSPINGEDQINIEDLTLSASTFNVEFGTDMHKDSQWQIRRNDTDDIVFDSLFDPTALESIKIPPDALEGGFDYRWRVRYRGENTEASEWSQETVFNGIKLEIEKPVNQYPLDDQRQVFRETTLEASAYSSNFDPDSHADTEFLIRNLSTGNVVDQPLLSGQAATSYDIPKGILEINTKYEWQVRYRGTELDWSEWSDITTFKTFENEDIILFTNNEPNNPNKLHKISTLTGELIGEYAGVSQTQVVESNGNSNTPNVWLNDSDNKGYIITTDDNPQVLSRKFFIECFDKTDLTLIDSLDITSAMVTRQNPNSTIGTDANGNEIGGIEEYAKDGENFYVSFFILENIPDGNGGTTSSRKHKLIRINFSTKTITAFSIIEIDGGYTTTLAVVNGYLFYGKPRTNNNTGNIRILDKSDLSVIRDDAGTEDENGNFDLRPIYHYDSATDSYYYNKTSAGDKGSSGVTTVNKVTIPTNPTDTSVRFSDPVQFVVFNTNFQISPSGENMFINTTFFDSDSSTTRHGINKLNNLDGTSKLSNSYDDGTTISRIFLSGNNIICSDGQNDQIVFIDINDLTIINKVPISVVPGGINYRDFTVI